MTQGSLKDLGEMRNVGRLSWTSRSITNPKKKVGGGPFPAGGPGGGEEKLRIEDCRKDI